MNKLDQMIQRKRSAEDLAWISNTLGKIDVGQYVSKTYSTHARKIIKIVKNESMIMLYCNDLRGNLYPFIIGDSKTKIDVLIDHHTYEPVEDLSLYGVS